MANETRPAVRKFEGTTLEKIEAALREEKGVVLTETEEKILKRYETAVSIMRGNRFPRTEQKCVKMLAKIFDISERQAWLDVNATQKIFGSFLNSNKDFKRHLASEWGVQAIQLAFKQKDIPGINAAIKNYVLINGIDKNDPDIPDPESYRPSKYVLEINIKEGAKPLTIDINKLGDIEDVNFEAILNSVESQEIDVVAMQKMLEEEEDANKED